MRLCVPMHKLNVPTSSVDCHVCSAPLRLFPIPGLLTSCEHDDHGSATAVRLIKIRQASSAKAR